MRSNARFIVALLLGLLGAGIASARPARAIPIFAQRYHLQCGACHSVLPELNAFGTYFRDHGYRLPLPVHGTTIFAIRYQMAYAKAPAAGTRRWTPGGILLGSANIGAITAFVHYNLGAGGGPSALFLGYLATYNAHTDSLYRLGLFELPLLQSPGQRLDDLQPYGYYGTHVGLNDLPLSSPRWGLQMERHIGDLRVDATAALGAYQGAAYGGKPLATGESTSAARPELGLWLDQGVLDGAFALDVGGEALQGGRTIVQSGGKTFVDPYARYGLLAHAAWGALDVQAEQFWGSDRNADGFSTLQRSSGGYVRLKYYPIPHAYVGIRYDASANPLVNRDWTYYAAGMIAPVRLLIQEVQPPGQHPSLGGAMTIAFPGFWKL